jgi:rhodanese-related sulfurtransferase
MKICICGIGGAGGKITSNFLENVDLNSKFLSSITDAKCISPGKVMGIWLDADKDDAKNKQHFFKDLTEGGYPGFFIPHDAVTTGCELHKELKTKYGYNIKKQGFVRDAQYLKAIFEIFDSDREIQKMAAGRTGGSQNPIFDSAWEAIEPYTILGDGDCDAILFVVSFGGGTGTGLVNPIVDHIRKSGNTDFPIFVLGVLTEPGDENKSGQPSKEGQRYLAAVSAIYDLLTKRNGASGVILIDNEILKARTGKDRESQNKFVYDVMKPMITDRDYPGENPVGQAQEKEFTRGLNWSPIFVPVYWSEPKREGAEAELVKKALCDGKLFDCFPSKADKAVVYCRGFLDSGEIEQALHNEGIKNVQVYRKIGEKNNELLILLRNPYGCDPQAYKTDGTLENKFCKIIGSVLNYMDENVEDLFYEGKNSQKMVETEDDAAVKLTKLSKDALTQFFFGKEGYIRGSIGKTEGLAFELREARKRLEEGQNPSEEPLFCKSLRIFKNNNRDQSHKDCINRDEQSVSNIPNIDEKMIEDMFEKKLQEMLEKPDCRQKIVKIAKDGS